MRNEARRLLKRFIFSLISVIFSVPFLAALLIQFPFLDSAFAQSSAFTYEGRLFDASGVPVLDSVSVKFQILNPAGTCVLYEEVQDAVNLVSSKGAFSLGVGSPVSDTKRSANFRGAYNPSMVSIFRNGTTLSAIPAAGCAAGTYTAGSSDTRLLRVHVTKGTTTETLSPDLVINTAPYAQVAQSLQGFLPSDFLRLDVANGISGNIGLTATGTGAGQTREFRFYELAANGVEYSAFKAPDAMATSLTYVLPSSAPSAGDILKATVPSSGVVTLSWGADAGAGGGISSFNGSNQSSQSFTAVDIAAAVTAPAWSTNVGTGAHTLQIPMAIGAGVTGGLITKTEHTSFSAKVDRAGDTMTGLLNFTGASGVSLAGTSGITFTGTGTIAMGTNKITGMSDPSAAQEAATKAYVDSQNSGKISGTLTATRIPFATGASTVSDDAALVWDNTAKNLGVGISSPATKLDISGTDTDGTFRVYDQTAASGVTRSIVRAGAGQTTTNLMEWQNNAGTVLSRIDSTGKFVGDGSLLTGVTGAVSGLTAGRVALSTAATTVGDSANFTFNSTTGAMGIGGTAPSITSGDVITIAAGGTNKNVVLTPSGTGYTLLNGNVGIGTTSPASGLHMVGKNLRIEPNAGQSTNAILTKQGTGWDASALALEYAGGNSLGIGTSQNTPLYLYSGGGRALSITGPSNGGAHTTAMTRQIAANHTSMASFKVEPATVHPSNSVTDLYAIYVPTANVGATATNAYGLFVSAPTGATNNYAAAFSTGNVGIGTTTPASKLHVGAAPAGSANFGLMSLGSAPFDGTTAGFFTGHASGTVVAGNSASGYAGDLVNLQIAGVQKFKVDKDGKIYGDGSTLSNVSGAVSGLTATRIPFAASATTMADSANLSYVTGSNQLLVAGNPTTSALAVTGAPASGATKSLVQVGPAIAGGSANGTMIGVNAPSGFTGNLLDLQVNGAQTMIVDKDGIISNGPGATYNYSIDGRYGYFSATSYGSSAFSGQQYDFALQVATASVNSTTSHLTGRDTFQLHWSANNNHSGTIDTGIGRSAASTIEINKGPAGTRGQLAAGSTTVYDNTAATGVSTLTVRAGAGQAATNLMEWQNNAGTILSRVDSTGKFVGDGSLLTGLSGAISGLTAGRVPVAASATSISDSANFTFNSTTGAMAINGSAPSITSGDALTIAAGGTNKNVVLTPSGTGYTVLNGNVGIGTTSPTGKLTVVENGATGVLHLQNNSTSGYAAVDLKDNGGTTQGSFGYANTSAAWMPGVFYINTSTSATPIAFMVNSSEKMRILNSGNVGIGTATPDLLLTIAPPANAPATMGLKSSGGAGAAIGFGYSGTYSAAIAYNDAVANAITFRTAGTTSGFDRMTITSTGAVGIGTTSPAARLHIVSPTGTTAPVSEAELSSATSRPTSFAVKAYSTSISATTAGPALRFLLQDDSGVENSLGAVVAQRTGADDTGTMVIHTKNAGATVESLTILPAGNVGIGTTSPNEKLEVSGNIRLTPLNGGGTTTATIDNNGNIIRTPSDERLKTQIEPLEGSLERILKVQGVSYYWKNQESFGSAKDIGFIAQDLEKVVPEVVRQSQDPERRRSVSYANMVALLVEALKEMYQDVTGHSREIASLRTENSSLKSDNIELKSKSAELQTEVTALKSWACSQAPRPTFCK